MEFINEKNRIYAKNEQNKTLAEVTFYEIKDGIYNIDHTFVDETLRGEGIGSKLVEEAVKQIRKNGGEVEATCPFAKKWLEENTKLM